MTRTSSARLAAERECRRAPSVCEVAERSATRSRISAPASSRRHGSIRLGFSLAVMEGSSADLYFQKTIENIAETCLKGHRLADLLADLQSHSQPIELTEILRPCWLIGC